MKLQTYKNIWQDLNRRIFAGLLIQPRILFTRNNTLRGAYYTNRRESIIEIHRNATCNLQAANELMYHEMTHQYVEEFLGIEEKEHHGPIFWRNYKLFAPKGFYLFSGDPIGAGFPTG